MTFQSALKKIQDNWSKLEHETLGGHEAVWMVDDDLSAIYEVDEERIGMKGDGTLVWAYASGCSCWDGECDCEIAKDYKVLQLNHEGLQKDWQKKVISFAESII